ncbi:class I SAM-dependent methyltransferase [bacterium]|nr:MAG: class I SAM-dependent methyltransferase [bacterium]
MKNWPDILKKDFDHPAIVLWRAIELRAIEQVIGKTFLKEPVLDLGCAEGKIGEVLFKGKRLIGLDNCWELLSQNQKSGTYTGLVLSDACQMPYKNEVFGSIFSNCVIEHIPNIDRVLDEASRVLNTGGTLLFSVPSQKFADFLFFSIIFDNLRLKTFSGWYKKKRNRMLNHYHCYDHKHWKEILEKKGFDLTGYKYYMTRKVTFVWDFLAFLWFGLKFIKPLSSLLPKVSRRLVGSLNKYYLMDSGIGSGLVLMAKKRET